MNIEHYAELKKITVENILTGVWGKRGRDKWQMIGLGINRSTQSVRTKVYSLLGGRKVRTVVVHSKNHDRTRRFSLAEDRRLVMALEKFKAIRGDKVVVGVKIDWQAIAEKVKTRTGPSCRQRWLFYLSKEPGFIAFPFSFGPKNVWKMCKLVRDYIISNGIKDFIDIPWEDVQEKTEVPLLTHEMSKKFQDYLSANFRSSLGYTFQRKIQLLRRKRNILKIPIGVKHWNDVC